ncbi:hypothetical protein A2911_00385 [Candidatus Nomurabacteria bacterium RIFCSPLOWO2_01_FULL_40_15]|uniref:Uncharacterized protein n=1 Tax=Candidatus Nomurabacteria bacterium RIFCSPLOWO2_01_FULL_40_15 TaxID=1801772 RepID=A0A1F6X8P7_9BACT|nr:MAG: hypothetical protein A2911_00385 [Candidatus Nomurabacteria bacterium RIFCSPLOWO2_01_FULL_40_15]
MKKFTLIFLFLAVVAGITARYYFHNKDVLYESSAVIAKTEAQALAEKVGMLMLLPTGEVPTVATVSDPKVLQNQSFFIDVKKGDKVLIYANAQKAVLYRPEIDKIVNIAPVNFGVDKKIFQSQFENKLNVESDENTF